LKLLLDDGDQHVGGHGAPDLRLHGVLAGAEEFLDALRFTSEKARELGLRFDLTLGSGWPFGGPTVSIDHAAGRLRYEHIKVDANTRFVKVPSIGAGEKFLAAFLARTEGSSFAYDSIRELTNIKDGVIELNSLPAGSHEVLFFISSRTGMQVKRPAVGAEGFVLDHMNRAATDSYLKTVGDRLLQPLGNNLPYSVFCDSLEVYNSDWSSDFLEEFQKRRGYDLCCGNHAPRAVDVAHARATNIKLVQVVRAIKAITVVQIGRECRASGIRINIRSAIIVEPQCA